MENKKLIKAAVISDRILKILRAITLMAVIVIAVLAVVVVAFGEQIMAEATVSSNDISFGGLRLTLKDGVDVLNKDGNRFTLLLMLLPVGIYVGILLYGIQLLHKVLQPMKEGRPFDPGTSSKISKLAWVVLIGGAVGAFCEGISTLVELGAYQLTTLFNPETVAGFTVEYTMQLDFLVVAGVLFLLALVFRYGEELQRQSDETL